MAMRVRGRHQRSTPSATQVVVVGTDLADVRDEAIREALAQVAGHRSAELHLVHALDAKPRGMVSKRAIDKMSTELESGAARLRTFASKLGVRGAAGCDVTLHTRIPGAAEALVQTAIDVGARLIVVGTRGRGAVHALLRGSVSAELIRTAPCSVLVVRSMARGLPRSPKVQPVCAACLARRQATRGASWWCERHESRRRLPLHVYSYTRSIPFVVPSADTA